MLAVTPPVSLSDSAEGEWYIVGCELRLTTRFIWNICDPVTKAFSVADLLNVHLGDMQSIGHDYSIRGPGL